jgi:hypothetical protein
MTLDEFYHRPNALTHSVGQQRIYAPQAYAAVREAPLVPVVTTEASMVAAWHPICWRKSKEAFAMVALRSLMDAGRGQPQEAARAGEALPWLLQAYPIVVRRPVARDAPIEIEDVFPDSPTDIGSTILTPDGKPSRGTAQRLSVAVRFAADFAATEAVTNRLADAGLLEPWPLRFDLGGGSVLERDDLWVVDFAALRGGGGRKLREALGAAGLRFIMLHRISLFRVAALVSAARRALAEPASPPPAPERSLRFAEMA